MAANEETKDDLVKGTLALRDKCARYRGQLEKQLGLSEDALDHRTVCFGMVFKYATQAAELLSYYYSVWSNPPVQLSPAQLKERRNQNAERCMYCLKVLFVFSLSAIEYNAKEVFGENNYLRNIMIKSANNKNKLIDENTLKDWEHIIDIRNCIVHNNAIASEDADYTIGGLHVVTTKGIMMKGKLDFFLVLTDLTVDRYYDWVKARIPKSL